MQDAGCRAGENRLKQHLARYATRHTEGQSIGQLPSETSLRMAFKEYNGATAELGTREIWQERTWLPANPRLA